MLDQIRLDIMTKLANNFTSEQLNIINNVISSVLINYEIKPICTDIIVKNEDIPNEIKSFIVCKSMKGLTEGSLEHYKRILINFALSINKNIKQLNSNDIRLYLINYEKKRNVSKSTIDDIRRVLSSFYKWMVNEGLITVNPMAKIEVIKCEKRIKEHLTIMELEQMRSACETARELAILETLYSTACRVSEIVKLNKNDINFDTGMVKVYGKGKKERIVFLNAKAQIALNKYIFTRRDNNEALFVSSKKPYNRLGKTSIEKEIKNIANRAGIRHKVYPHLIRACTATTMSSRGADLYEIQAYLGHSNPSTTQIYLNINYDNLKYTFTKCIV